MIFWSHPGSRQGKLRGGREGRRSRLTPQRGCCIVHQMNQQSTGRCRIERAGWKCAAAAGSATGARAISISRTEADRYRRSPESPTEHSDQICHWRFARDDSPAPSGDHFGELRSWLARATPARLRADHGRAMRTSVAASSTGAAASRAGRWVSPGGVAARVSTARVGLVVRGIHHPARLRCAVFSATDSRGERARALEDAAADGRRARSLGGVEASVSSRCDAARAGKPRTRLSPGLGCPRRARRWLGGAARGSLVSLATVPAHPRGSRWGAARVAPFTPAGPPPSPRLSRLRLRRRQGQGPRIHG